MTLEEAIELLRKMYDTALKMPCVFNPVAWALYQTWKVADIKGKKRKTNAGEI